MSRAPSSGTDPPTRATQSTGKTNWAPSWTVITHQTSKHNLNRHCFVFFLVTVYNVTRKQYEHNIEHCEVGRRPPEGKVCNVVFDKNWDPCVKRKGFNYNNATGGPCIFLKLNKIFGWVPEYYNKTHLPANMPQDLKDYISVIEDENQVGLWL